jgi:hypothetical protein
MKTTISTFASLVARDYGSQVAREFTSQFSAPSTEVKFSEAMVVLDRVLGSQNAPMPAFGPTNSVPQQGTLTVEDD